jgi:hypothetical protein
MWACIQPLEVYDMHRMKLFTLVATAVFAAIAAVPTTQAQITISVGAVPICPYGYYDYAPYNCSPYGHVGLHCGFNVGILGRGC